MRSMTLRAKLLTPAGNYRAGDIIDYEYYDDSDGSVKLYAEVSEQAGRGWLWEGEFELVRDEGVEETPDESKKPVYAVTIKVTTLRELGRVLDFIEDEGIAGDTTLKVEEN